MGELIILSEWREKKAIQELAKLSQEVEDVISEMKIMIDYVIFDYNGDPVVIDSKLL